MIKLSNVHAHSAEGEVRSIVHRCLQDAYVLGYTGSWADDASAELRMMEEAAVSSIWLALSGLGLACDCSLPDEVPTPCEGTGEGPVPEPANDGHDECVGCDVPPADCPFNLTGLPRHGLPSDVVADMLAGCELASGMSDVQLAETFGGSVVEWYVGAPPSL
jgi:hypothetical protein